jgi:hypothetical protein
MKNQIAMTSATIALAAFFTLPTQAGSQSDWKNHPIKFPRELFIGTPEGSVKLPNLDRSKAPVLALMAPEGTRKLSRGKPVTASDDLPILGELEMITDGDKDGADGSYVELGSDKQWVQIDLEKESAIYGIVLWHYHKKARAYLDVIVQISNDPKFEKGVTTVYNNDHDNSSAMGKGDDKTWIETNHGRIVEPEGEKGRYVRLYSKGNTSNEMNHYVEVEVYGK